MPDETPDVTHFMNMGGYVAHYKPISSVNDKNFRFPIHPLTTRYEQNDPSLFCNVDSKCEREGGCECITVLDIGDNVTVRLVISTVGEERNSTHSMHIHGHSVHVLKFDYGEYSNGSLLGSSRDLTCTEDGDDFDTLGCPNPCFRYSNMSLRALTHAQFERTPSFCRLVGTWWFSFDQTILATGLFP